MGVAESVETEKSHGNRADRSAEMSLYRKGKTWNASARRHSESWETSEAAAAAGAAIAREAATVLGSLENSARAKEASLLLVRHVRSENWGFGRRNAGGSKVYH